MKRLVILAAVWGLAGAAGSGAGKSAPAGRPAYPPTSAYEVRRMHGWKVYIHKGLLTTHKDVGEKAIRLLEFKLDRIVRMVPPAAVAKLREVPIWLSRADDPRKVRRCACYHPSADWLRNNGYNPDKARSVDITNPRNFLAWSKQQPNMVLHELAHAYHHRVVGHGNPLIRAAFEKARKSGRYESVLHVSGREKRAYAMNNIQEYFAEATEAMYGTNDFYPFVRCELKEHDPDLYEALRKVWREPQDPAKPTRRPARPKGPDPKASTTARRTEGPSSGRAGKAAPAARPRYTPTDQWVRRNVEGWTVYFHPTLVRDHPELDAEVLYVLTGRLLEVARMVPPKALEKLRKVRIWMDYEHWRSRAGGYHPGRDWLVKNGYNPDKTDGIEFPRAEAFLRVVRVQPSVVLHELAHAYHDQVLPGGYGNEQIRAAYEAAKKAGLYDACLLYTGRRLRAYAMTNPMEYFAELSEAYFGTNDFYPFVRPELKRHDPRGYELLRKLWGS